MRDTKRIQRMLDKLHDLWYSNPDWRFGQLVENLFGPEYRIQAYTEDRLHRCYFYIEDDKAEQLLDDALRANGIPE